MIVRVLLGILAALRAVLITGQAELMMQRPLNRPRIALPHPPWGARAYASPRAAERR